MKNIKELTLGQAMQYCRKKSIEYSSQDKIAKATGIDKWKIRLIERDESLPTKEEWQELIDNTTTAWTENYNDSRINGLVLTSKINGNSIFIPAIGMTLFNQCMFYSIFGAYYTSSLVSEEITASYFVFSNSSFITVHYDGRVIGLPLRAVKE